jgi:hypothetical protein
MLITSITVKDSENLVDALGLDFYSDRFVKLISAAHEAYHESDGISQGILDTIKAVEGVTPEELIFTSSIITQFHEEGCKMYSSMMKFIFIHRHGKEIESLLKEMDPEAMFKMSTLRLMRNEPIPDDLPEGIKKILNLIRGFSGTAQVEFAGERSSRHMDDIMGNFMAFMGKAGKA